MQQRIVKLVPILALILVVTGCAGQGDSGDDAAGRELAEAAEDMMSDEMSDTTSSAASDEDRAVAGETVSFDTPNSRKVIQTATIAIEAEDTRAAMGAIETLVTDSGGFIASATVSDPGPGEDQPRVHLVLRVPAADLETALDAIGRLGARIVSESRQGRDVTEEYVDVEARIANLEVLETELRALLGDVRDQPEADPTKLLQVFNEISRVRGEIEQLEGRRQVLDDLTTLATLEVTIDPTPEVAPVVAEGWAPTGVFRDSVRSLVAAFQGLADLGIRFVVLGLPLLIVVVGIPGLILWRLRRFFGPATPPAPTEPSA